MWNKKIISGLVLVTLAFPIAGCSGVMQPANGEQAKKVAVIDYQVVLGNHPARQDADKKLNEKFTELQQKAMAIQKDDSISPEDKNTQLQGLQNELMAAEKENFVPVKHEVDAKIDEVLKEKGYDAVFSKQALIRGGEDITGDVLRKEGLDEDAVKKALDASDTAMDNYR